MINDPFFMKYLNQKQSSPKVISVPIHFISSHKQHQTNEAAALTIQRVFRGFLVRKSVKKISSIENEVSEIEKRINNNDVVDLIRTDAKERLKVNETLMSLLFKLDSIRGVDLGVRDLRKAVIKRAIAIQEKVDSTVTSEIENVEIESVNDSSTFPDEIVDDSVKLAADGDRGSVKNKNEEIDDELKEDNVENNSANDSSTFRDEIVDDSVNVAARDEIVDDSVNVAARDEIVDDSVNLAVRDEIVDDSVKNINEEIDDESKEVLKKIEGNCNHVEAVDKKRERTEDNERNIQLLEKLMDDNEKMMILMKQMFERNEMQTRMLNSLSQRVEQLEKTFMGDKSRRKKKKRRLP